MADKSFIGGVTIQMGDGATPTENFVALKKVNGFSGLGKTNPLVEDSSFDSVGAREYIAGLADGKEVTMNQSYLPDNVEQKLLIANVDNRVNTNFRMIVDNGENDIVTFDFTVVPLDWDFAPSWEDKNNIAFQLKISGDITRDYTAQPSP
ncbi:hypothetical protein [Methylophaga lonarensis]|uniref:hypothetical protein n=1 Tax=Methylophaga lonarensis TaxID=999151 RepID=UPI003D26A48F